MVFTVTYRAKDGALREERIEAADRAGCVAECRRRGIAPVLVAERSTSAKTGSGLRRTSGRGGRDKEARARGRDGARPSQAENGQDARSPSQRAGRPLSQWIVAVLIAAATAGGVWWWIGRGGARPSPARASGTLAPTEARPSQAAANVNSRPAPAATAAATNAPAARTTAKGTRIPDDVKPDEFGVLRHPGGLRWVDTNNLHVVKHPRKKRLFKHHSENSIATILTLDPDKMAPFLVGRRPKFGQRFVDDFKASLYEEVEFPEDDTEEEREVRKAVVEVKKEMAEALKRGEDVAKMMNDAQAELDRLVSYRDTLMKQLKEIKLDEKYTDADVADFTAAANQMLKSQGLKELRTPNLTYRQFMLQRRRERAAANAEAQGGGANRQHAKETK